MIVNPEFRTLRGLMCVFAGVVLLLLSFPLTAQSKGGATPANGDYARAVVNPPVPHLAQDVPGMPFARFICVSLLGIITGFLRLWDRFRKFWGLGVITNFYAAIYILLGMVLCWPPYIAENSLLTLSSTWMWLLNICGSGAICYLAPIIGARSEKRPEPVDLDFPKTRNIAYAFLESQVQDRIRRRLHDEIIQASADYDWETITKAAEELLGIEIAFTSLSKSLYASELKSIKLLASSIEVEGTAGRKYRAITSVLRHTEFRHLKQLLQEKAREKASL